MWVMLTLQEGIRDEFDDADSVQVLLDLLVAVAEARPVIGVDRPALTPEDPIQQGDVTYCVRCGCHVRTDSLDGRAND